MYSYASRMSRQVKDLDTFKTLNVEKGIRFFVPLVETDVAQMAHDGTELKVDDAAEEGEDLEEEEEAMEGNEWRGDNGHKEEDAELISAQERKKYTQVCTEVAFAEAGDGDKLSAIRKGITLAAERVRSSAYHCQIAISIARILSNIHDKAIRQLLGANGKGIERYCRQLGITDILLLASVNQETELNPNSKAHVVESGAGSWSSGANTGAG